MEKFINSKIALEFANPESGEKVRIPAGFIGGIPEWAVKTPLYKLALSGDDPVVASVGNAEPVKRERPEK